MRKVMISLTEPMIKALEQEQRLRKLDNLPETIRNVLGEYFKLKETGGR